MGGEKETVSNVWLTIPMKRYANVLIVLPALSMFYCFWSAYLFRFGPEINDTDCNVTNSIPSASAVTGIKPQAYVWRICIGLQSAPHYFVAFMYYNYYAASLPHITKHQGLYKFMMSLCLWLYVIELTCLNTVACISNKENYSVHEKLFIAFMITSIANMLFSTIMFRWSRYKPMTEKEKRSYFWKRVLLATICVSTVGLIISFIQHRLYCIPGAFSVFSVFEYCICYSAIGYHATGYWEFSHKTLIIADVFSTSDADTNGTNGTMRTTRSVTNGRPKKD